MADELVKVSSNDTTSDFLGEKLVAGDRVRLTELNDGGDEQLEASVEGGLINLLPWWGNTDLSQSPEGTNAGHNFNWAVQGELRIDGSGWKPTPSQIGFQSGVPDFIFNQLENCWWIELTNPTSSPMNFFTWVPVPKATDDFTASIRARYDASLGSGNPLIYIIIADQSTEFSLGVATQLSSSFTTYQMPSTDLTAYGPETTVGFGVAMPAGSNRELRINQFWCEFI